jgi:hypothetical protein
MYYLHTMRKHNGMRPQDIVILLKIIAKGLAPWQNKDLAVELNISQSEISDSLGRSFIAGLVSETKKKVYHLALMEFIEHGLQYVFPAQPGTLVNGLPTAYSHPFMESIFKSDMPLVWSHVHGKVRGLSVEPLYKDVVGAAEKDAQLYKLLALIDVIRVGKVREKNVAIKELRKIISSNEPSKQHAKN